MDGIRTDNLEASVAELKAKGVEFRDEIREVRPGVKISFLGTPENVQIEIPERLYLYLVVGYPLFRLTTNLNIATII